MSREIKFRAWYPSDENGNGGWIQGFNMISFHDYFTKGLEPKLKRYDKEWLLSEVKLCQYTGLKDKNGRDIYEGDWIRSAPGYISFVKYDSKQAAFLSVYTHPEDGEELLLCDLGSEIEIIGNIYEKGGNNG